jgi:hypothetical protein
MGLKPDQALISIGFDKNGECDFAINMAIADLSLDRMNELRRMISVTVGQAELMWAQFGPVAFEMMSGQKAPSP